MIRLIVYQGREESNSREHVWREETVRSAPQLSLALRSLCPNECYLCLTSQSSYLEADKLIIQLGFILVIQGVIVDNQIFLID